MKRQSVWFTTGDGRGWLRGSIKTTPQQSVIGQHQSSVQFLMGNWKRKQTNSALKTQHQITQFMYVCPSALRPLHHSQKHTSVMLHTPVKDKDMRGGFGSNAHADRGTQHSTRPPPFIPAGHIRCQVSPVSRTISLKKQPAGFCIIVTHTHTKKFCSDVGHFTPR